MYKRQVSKALENCRKRAREELNTEIHQVFRQEFQPLYDQRLDMLTQIPKYSNVKSALCKERRKALGTTQNPSSSQEIFLNDSLKTFADGTPFFISDFENNSERMLVFGCNGVETFLRTYTCLLYTSRCV